MTNVSQKKRPLDFSLKFQRLEFDITNALRSMYVSKPRILSYKNELGLRKTKNRQVKL